MYVSASAWILDREMYGHWHLYVSAWCILSLSANHGSERPKELKDRKEVVGQRSRKTTIRYSPPPLSIACLLCVKIPGTPTPEPCIERILSHLRCVCALFSIGVLLLLVLLPPPLSLLNSVPISILLLYRKAMYSWRWTKSVNTRTPKIAGEKNMQNYRIHQMQLKSTTDRTLENKR